MCTFLLCLLFFSWKLPALFFLHNSCCLSFSTKLTLSEYGQKSITRVSDKLGNDRAHNLASDRLANGRLSQALEASQLWREDARERLKESGEKDVGTIKSIPDEMDLRAQVALCHRGVHTAA